MGFEIRADEIATGAVGRPIADDELAALDEDGFVVVTGLLDPGRLDEMRRRFDHLVRLDPHSRTHELGTRRADASRDDEAFAVCWRHRVVLDAAAHAIGPVFEVGHVNLRDPEPGHGEQRLHPDHGPEAVAGITATWFIDEFTVLNGSTRVLAGSHRCPPAERNVPGTERPGPGETVAVGPAGSVLVRDARLFHAAGCNTSGAPRRSALVFYQRTIPDPTG